MSFLTGTCDFLDAFTIVGGKLSQSTIYIEDKICDLKSLEDCLPFLLYRLGQSENTNGADTYYFYNVSLNDCNDEMLMSYYCFLIDAGVDQETALEYVFGNRDRDYIFSELVMHEKAIRGSIYKFMKFHFGCGDYKSFSKLFNELNGSSNK